MSYSSIHISASDEVLRGRVMACAAQEGSTYPEQDIMKLIWPVCTAQDVEAAYESALAASNPDPGGDLAVITDGMILAIVQPLLGAA